MEHQPYLFSKSNGETHLLFCKSEDKLNLVYGHPYQLQPWKIWVRDPVGNERDLPLEEENAQYGRCLVECNPHIFTRNSKRYLGYVAGYNQGDNTPLIYYHTTVEIDEDLNIIGPTVVGQLTFSGCFVGQDFLHAVRKGMVEKDVVMKNDEPIAFEGYPIWVCRLCPIFDREGFFILTGLQDGNRRSWVVSTNGNFSREILNSSGESVYKCTILGNTLVYTLTEGEDRALVYDTIDSTAFFS